MKEPTRIIANTEFGDAEFVADDPWTADKLLKAKLRKIGLPIKRLRYLREMQFNGELHILYAYTPTAFRYDREKARELAA